MFTRDFYEKQTVMDRTNRGQVNLAAVSARAGDFWKSCRDTRSKYLRDGQATVARIGLTNSMRIIRLALQQSTGIDDNDI